MKETMIKVLIVLLAIFAPAKSMIITSLVLIIVDLVTGLMAAHKTGDPITSAGLRRTVTKLFVYEVVILTAFLAQQYMTGPGIPVCNIVTSFIGLTELKSIVENMNIIGGGDLLKSIIEKLGSVNK